MYLCVCLCVCVWIYDSRLFFGPSYSDSSNLSENNDSDTTSIQVGVNELGTSRKHLMEGMKASLERMQLDYGPFFFCSFLHTHAFICAFFLFVFALFRF